MRCKLSKNENGGWSITPLSGRFKGKNIADADQVSIEKEGLADCGRITAVWGLTMLDDRVYDDLRTMRGLAIGGVFQQMTQEAA